MKCEFEESLYQDYINQELKWRKNFFPSPRVLENTIGIDTALFTYNQDFWKLFSDRRFPLSFLPYWKQGEFLKPELWDDFQNILNSDTFPKFRCNLFLQYKRPTYITTRRGLEYDDWNQPYYRYKITEYQCEILEKLEKRVNSNSLVVYGCPAFWKNKTLLKHYRNAEIVKNSNFVEPHKLLGHEKYTFIESGKIGKVHSETYEVESIDLLESIDYLDSLYEYKTNTEFIYSLSSSINEIIPELNEEFQVIYYSYQEELSFYHDLPNSLFSIRLFLALTHLKWNIKVEWKSNDKNEPLRPISVLNPLEQYLGIDFMERKKIKVIA